MVKRKVPNKRAHKQQEEEQKETWHAVVIQIGQKKKPNNKLGGNK